MILDFSKKKTYSPKVTKQLNEIVPNLPDFDSIVSVRSKLLIVNLQLCEAFAVYDYPKVIDLCDHYLSIFIKEKGTSGSFLFELLFKKSLAYLSINNHSEAIATIERSRKFTKHGSFNWNIALLYQLVICLHSKYYQQAYDIYLDAIDKSNDFYDAFKEDWTVLEAYIYFLIVSGKINEERKKKFYIGKFLNEVPTYSKDKRGLNIPILIIQSLFLLHRRRFSEVIDRTEALNTYAYRYLRRDETYRSNCFIKMILTLPAANFHRQAVIRRARKFREKLELEPLEVSGESSEVEIIPYEKLWEMVLDSLDDKYQ